MNIFDFSGGLPEPGYKLITPTGYSYTLTDVKPYVRRTDGGEGVILTWSSVCAECGVTITVTSGRASKGLTRRCDVHRKAGVPTTAAASTKQAAARKAYGERMKGYHAEYVAARDGEIPLRPTKILGEQLTADGFLVMGFKFNDRAERGMWFDGERLTCHDRRVDVTAFEPFMPAIREAFERLTAERLFA